MLRTAQTSAPAALLGAGRRTTQMTRRLRSQAGRLRQRGPGSARVQRERERHTLLLCEYVRPPRGRETRGQAQGLRTSKSARWSTLSRQRG